MFTGVVLIGIGFNQGFCSCPVEVAHFKVLDKAFH